MNFRQIDRLCPEASAFIADRLGLSICVDRVELPILPQAALRVYRVSRDPDTDLRQVAEIIQSDQRLAGEVIRVANSSAFWLRGRIRSINEAAMRLGLKRLTQVTFSAALSATVFNRGRQRARMEPARRLSLATGLWNQVLARTQGRDIDAAFLDGILHNLGEAAALGVILAHAGPSPLAMADEDLDVASRLLGRDLGPRLAVQWSLPEQVCAVIRCQAGLAVPKTWHDSVAAVSQARHLAEWTLGHGGDCGELLDRVMTEKDDSETWNEVIAESERIRAQVLGDAAV